MKITLFLFLVLSFSCTTIKDYQNVNYKSSKTSYTYKMTVAKGFQIKEIEGGGEWKRREFIYPDSSIVYISDEEGNTSRNYYNIKNNPVLYEKSVEAFFSKDTITISGVDDQGKYWKNKFDGKVNFGYLNVPKDKKEVFDKMIGFIVKK